MSHVCSQHSFAPPLRMNGMHKRQYHHARLDLLSLDRNLVTRVLTISSVKLMQSTMILTYDRCPKHSINLWLLLVNKLYSGSNTVAITCIFCFSLTTSLISHCDPNRNFWREKGCFLVLRKLLLVSFCVVVWVLFSVFSIFCITSLVSATPRNHREKV